ncbi:MAG: plasmid mobilization relaxosome protein MobC [Bryobacterales bacterium]|nr:plasmid mobilization relaxosome protein MobC [Bryobacterales bacterium]
MGRYEKNYTGERRTEFIGFYVTPSERRQIEEAATEAGSPTLSDWARDLLLARSAQAAMLRAQRRNPEAKGIMDAFHASAQALNAVGNNLNQIARHLNTTGELRDWSELRDALTMFQKGTAQHMAVVARVLDL